MRPVPFSGMMCQPSDIEKDGDFKIKGRISTGSDCPPIDRCEFFACKEERDLRYNLIMNMLKEGR